MKKKIIYFIVVMLCLSSCGKDFLELAPVTNLTDATFYKTESQFDLALVAV